MVKYVMRRSTVSQTSLLYIDIIRYLIKLTPSSQNMPTQSHIFNPASYLTPDLFYRRSSACIPHLQSCLTINSVACLSYIPTAMSTTALLFRQLIMNVRPSIFQKMSQMMAAIFHKMTQMIATIPEPGHRLRLIVLKQSWSKILKKSSAGRHTR